ncbi:ribose transport system permease protein [Lachnospiraceae bacterium PF1-21]|uniref:ABC transporter permease n=1 Tax=Ohessyouella blattaphilus TaxID=2949333 RepID=A0ABT1EEA2_9FIRM|nr:ABC transporter permease [Ohessyouella blattaphilus]MCP1109028.1 ABC transporter permease [Ohessyouella blattaphilus]MCR8562422.1 ABC transporter permease [Ohessyouella blattaphilus]
MKSKVVYQLKDKAIWLVLIFLVIVFTIANPRFVNPNNILTLLRQVSMYGIASIGMTFVILLGDIDLSTGTIISFVNIICAYFMVHMGMNMWLAIILTLLASTVIGLLNGFMVSTVGMPAIIATFAVQTAFQGLALIISGGLPINGFTEKFKVFGQGYVGIIPVPVIIMALCFALGSFILNKTYFGRYFYAVGGNIEAAKLSGIRVGRIKYLVFAISGFFAGLAGIVMLSRVNSGMATAGLGYEFDVITCVVLGGVSVTGGYGKMSGVVAGTFIIGALQNGMVLMNINSYVQDIVMGVVLALAVGFDCIQKKRKAN